MEFTRFWMIALALTAVKLLLVPCYHSTDFEVHRNWLAITHNLPLAEWYTEATSEWTLDYPPFFAWFEYCLSHLAKRFDPAMLEVMNLNYASNATLLFQRLSVIGTDFLYIYAVKQYATNCMSSNGRPSKTAAQITAAAVLLLANFGLFLIDHIHFQYNGFLFGMLLMSITKMAQGREIQGALWFAVLLNFKHIFLYLAPAYFIYLLRHFCFKKNYPDGRIVWTSFSPVRLIQLAVVVLATFALSFGPFILKGQLEQVISRLFPFKRGLCHAYWAPNFWALYNIADKFLQVVGSKTGILTARHNLTASMTGGLVQEFNHAVLPSVNPLTTLICTLIAMLPGLLHMWRWVLGPRGFIRGLVLCGFASFMFGWHVHEKAITMVIIPLTLLAVEKRYDAQLFLFLSTVGHFALLPLIFTLAEMPVKYLLLICYTILAFTLVHNIYHEKKPWRLPLLNILETLYLLGLVPLEVYCSVIHPLLGLSTVLPFFPLLLTSCYCAVGVLYSWFSFYKLSLNDTQLYTEKKTQ